MFSKVFVLVGPKNQQDGDIQSASNIYVVEEDFYIIGNLI